MRHLSIQQGPEGIAVLTMSNADEAMNLVSEAWLTEMEDAVAGLIGDASVRGVVLTSSRTAFMAGADLKMLVAQYGRLSPAQAYAFSQRATRLHRTIETGGKTWVAALNGLALGGGFELALACHRRIIVDDPNALVGLPEVNVGLLPGSGGTQRLLRLAGAAVALDLLLSGRSVPPAEALKLGIVDEVVPAPGLLEHARGWAASNRGAAQPWDVKGYKPAESTGLLDPRTASIFSAGTASAAKVGYNLPARAAILSCVFEGAQLPFDRALSVESKYFARLLTDPVARNIIRTTFLSKNAAERGANRPKHVPASPVRKVGVIGAGMMGAGIALVAARAGLSVVLIDRTVDLAEKGRSYSTRSLSQDVAKGRMNAETAEAVTGRILATDDFVDLAGCDLVVEAVFEDTAIKAETTRRAEAVIAADAIYSSNTSTLPITGLAKASVRPAQFIGLHFFSPVERMALVEVILGRETSEETLAHALDFVALLRKTPIVVKDGRGFYTSRVFQTFIHEGAAMLGEGVAPALIENAARLAGFPVGPLALLDEVTLDLPLKIVDQTLAEDGAAYVPPAGTAVMRKMASLGRFSRKAGGGFYDYPADGPKRLWTGLADAFPRAAEQPDVEEVRRRLLYVQALETVRCLDEEVLTTVEDADLGAVLGWGFPAWTGGTISYIDTVGTDDFVREADRLAQRHGARFSPSASLRARAERGSPFYAADEVAACAA